MVMRTVAAMYLQRAKLTERTKSSDVVALRRRWQLAVGSCGRLHVSETAAIRLNTRERACVGVNIDRQATGWQGFGLGDIVQHERQEGNGGKPDDLEVRVKDDERDNALGNCGQKVEEEV